MSDRHDSVIASLAILMVNWDEDRDNDYLRPFVELLAEVIYRNDDGVLTVGNLQKQYRESFRLKLPAGVIRSLLRRLEKSKYIKRIDGHYKPNIIRLRDRDFHVKRQEMLDRYESLVHKLMEYCEVHFDKKLSYTDAMQYLESFLAEHQSELMHAMIAGTQPVVPVLSSGNASQKYMTGSFIYDIASSEAQEFRYLEQVLQGMMLSNVLYLPDNRRIKKRWTTAIYFDTPFLVEALGYQGKAKQELRTELLRGLRGTAAKLRCFAHNLQEVRNILYASLGIIERGNISEAYGPMVATIDYIIEEGFTPSELFLEIARIEDELEKLGIEVYDKPEYVEELGIDEAALERILAEKYSGNGGNDKDLQRKNDIDSVASIYRLRKGKSFRSIEDCKAIFVTNNVALLKASHGQFREREGEITHCITDFTLSNFLWLLSPDSLPDMPRKLIIADAFAATQPDPRLWNKYIRKIEVLKSRRAIEADDFYAFRFTQEARASLMEVTRGSDDAITDGTVQEVMNSVKRKFQQETVDEATRKLAEFQRDADKRSETLTKELEREQNKRKTLMERDLKLSTNRKKRSRMWARKIVSAIRYSVIALYVFVWLAGVRTQLIAQLLGAADDWILVAADLASLILLVFLVIETRDGRSISALLNQGERRLAKWIEARLVRITE